MSSKHRCSPPAAPTSPECDKAWWYCPFPCWRRWVWTPRKGWH